MTRIPLTALVALALALAGCGNAAGGIDHSDPQDVARAYAIADHEHDHKTVYNLLHLSRREGASRSEWVDEQEERVADGIRRYESDNAYARRPEPRTVEKVETSPSTIPIKDTTANARAVDVVIDFADGSQEMFTYTLVETDDGWRVEATLNPS